MNKETKELIIDAAHAYSREVGWANGDGEIGINKLSDLSGVSVTYLSPMMQGVFQYRNARTGKLHDIPADHFATLADCIGCVYGRTYWEHKNTAQFSTIIRELTYAKENAQTRVIIGDSGCGKSYAIERFKRANPMGTWVIKCFREDTLGDLLCKIEDQMKISAYGTTSRRIDRISLEFRMRRNVNPILIIDESEALTVRTFAALKALYDAFSIQKSIVLIGTSDLVDTMERAKRAKRPGMPQFYRRFKSGVRVLQPMDGGFDLFLDEYNLKGSFRKLMQSLCENYGELHDYIEPAARKADEMGVELTEEFFTEYHGL